MLGATIARDSSGTATSRRAGRRSASQGCPASRAFQRAGRMTCATMASGSLYCWGGGDIGVISIPDMPLRPNLLQLDSVAQVAVGRIGHACATLTGGDLYCWGDNTSGELGLGSASSRFPARVNIGGIAEAALGQEHSCARTRTGELYCWGRGEHGRLGTGSQETQRTPLRVSVAGTVAVVSAGDKHTCAATAAGLLYCWGDGSMGQLGGGSTTTFDTPQLVSLSGVVSVAAGDNAHVRADGCRRSVLLGLLAGARNWRCVSEQLAAARDGNSKRRNTVSARRYNVRRNDRRRALLLGTNP